MKKIPSLVAVLILTMITSLAWVGFSVYRAFATKPSPVIQKEVGEPLDPNLNESTIEKIKARIFLNEGEIPQTLIVTTTPTPSPTPIAEVTPEPETEATLSPEEEELLNEGQLFE